MPARIEEGRLVETSTPDGTERRAFGELTSQRGELSSYAVGWTTGGDAVARLTIGIGAGNEGGGSFHVEAFPGDDGLAYRLVDTPFERVPEGGPDLTAEAARAHEDLPYVWDVVDVVMARDRRALWMRHWLLGTSAFLTPEVAAGDEPIVVVVHEAAGDWQLLGSTPVRDGPDAAVLAHLFHSLGDDPSLVAVLDLAAGAEATREQPGAPWVRTDREAPAPRRARGVLGRLRGARH